MERREFIKTATFTLPMVSFMKLKSFETISNSFIKTEKMPALFLAHGHPINAVLDTEFTRTLRKISNNIAKPNAIMVISAHWETNGTFVSVNPKPKTIYDFGNFDKRLFEIKYEPKGQPILAKETSKLSKLINEDSKMGLDHGAWTILKYLYPNADIPVYQLSIDYTKKTEYHFQLAKQLTSLRKKGVLIIGSGNIVHNLRMLNWFNQNEKPYDWVLEFDMNVKHKLETQQFKELINYKTMGNSALLSIPTNEHYLPMLYILGLMKKEEEITHLYEGYEFGGLSMRSFMVS